MVRLYGKGAVVLSHGHTEYRATAGVLTVPPQLVPRARALGFTPHRPAEMEEPTGPVGPATAEMALPADHPAAGAAAAIARGARDHRAEAPPTSAPRKR